MDFSKLLPQGPFQILMNPSPSLTPWSRKPLDFKRLENLNGSVRLA